MVAYVPGLMAVLAVLALFCTLAGFAGKMGWQPPVLLLCLIELLRFWPKG